MQCQYREITVTDQTRATLSDERIEGVQPEGRGSPTIHIDPIRRLAHVPLGVELGPLLTAQWSTWFANKPVAHDITAVIPVYNTPPEFLHCCMESIFHQTVSPARVLVIDDRSTDWETCRYLEALRNLPHIDIVRNERNLSLGPTMNRALAICRTRYLLKLDSDDVARRRMMERLSAYAEQAGDLDVLGCQWHSFGLESSVTCHPEKITRSYVIHSGGHWIVNHTGVLLNRESLLAVRGYRRMRGLAEDYELWVRMMVRGFHRFFNVPEILVERRDRANGLHRNFRRGWNRLMLACMKGMMRTCPDF